MRALTGSEVLVEDKLFATLDTTVRALKPETKPRVLVSDTVGFIKKLPHETPNCPVALGRALAAPAIPARPLVLELLRQNSGLTVRVNELLAQNKALLARIAELEAKHGKPPKTPDNSSLPPSRGQKGNVTEPTRVKKARKGHPGAARALAENPDATRRRFGKVEGLGRAVRHIL